MDCSTPSFPVLHSLLEFSQTHFHWVGDSNEPSHPLLLSSIFPSIRVFSSRSALCIRWPGYWNFSLSIIPSNEYSRLISFWIDWFEFLAVQGALRSLLQHHNLKATVLDAQPSLVQLSHPLITTGKNTALTQSIQSLCHVWLLGPRGLQNARLPYTKPVPRPCSNSCPWSQWCHPTLSFSVIPFSSCLQSFTASGSLPMS